MKRKKGHGEFSISELREAVELESKARHERTQYWSQHITGNMAEMIPNEMREYNRLQDIESEATERVLQLARSVTKSHPASQ